MRRNWNSLVGPQGSGRRFATALGCISTERYVQSVYALHQGLHAGMEATVHAERGKFDAEGQKLEDPQQPGDYLTLSYVFSVGEETWTVDREPNYEGERSAEDFADALGQAADRDFCEAMVQLKCAFDRWGGQAFIRAYQRENMVVGFLYSYQHIARDQPREPDADFENPPELEPEAVEEPEQEPETPEEEAELIEAERAAA